MMKDKLKDFFASKAIITDEAMQAYLKGVEAVKESTNALNDIRTNFIHGGGISYDDFLRYEISTPDNPKPYSIGAYITIYRLPSSEPDTLLFDTIFNPPLGKEARLGWHYHKDMTEEVIQLEGTAEHDGKPLPPYSISVFQPGERHDYVMKEKGRCFVRFTKVEIKEEE
jgi:hypothetical protein